MPSRAFISDYSLDTNKIIQIELPNEKLSLYKSPQIMIYKNRESLKFAITTNIDLQIVYIDEIFGYDHLMSISSTKSHYRIFL